jgi:hypothetical protein
MPSVHDEGELHVWGHDCPGNVSSPQQQSRGCAVIIMTVTGGVIIAGLAWAGLHDYLRRRRDAGPSVAENFRRQREIDRQRIGDKGEGGGV